MTSVRQSWVCLSKTNYFIHSRKMNFCSLPVEVFGISVMRTSLGTLSVPGAGGSVQSAPQAWQRLVGWETFNDEVRIK